jgi:hypothetical protein
VLDQIAAREKIWNFAKIFGGVDSNNIWNTMVVVVCKMELICEKPKNRHNLKSDLMLPLCLIILRNVEFFCRGGRYQSCSS